MKNLSRKELISLFVQMILGHRQEEKIRYTLAIFTAMNMNVNDYFEDCDDVFQIIDTLFQYSDGNLKEKEIAWNLIINTVGIKKIVDIIENIDRYIQKYNRIVQPIDEIKLQLLELFTRDKEI